MSKVRLLPGCATVVGEVEFWVGTARFGGVVLAAAVLTLAATFFLDFPAARLGAVVDLGSGF